MDLKTDDEKNLISVYFLALDGDVKAALENLKAIDVKILSTKEKEIRNNYFERFGRKKLPHHPQGKSLVTNIKRAYLRNWDRVLLHKLDMNERGRFPFKKLIPIVERLGGNVGEWNEKEYDRIAKFLTSELQKTGY